MLTDEQREQYSRNFRVIYELAETLRSSYGPHARSKLVSVVVEYRDHPESEKEVVLSNQKILLTNDGLSILKSLNNESPFYKILLNQSYYIQTSIGDGVKQYVMILSHMLSSVAELSVDLKCMHGILRRCRDWLWFTSDLSKRIPVKIDITKEGVLEGLVQTSLAGNILSTDYQFVTGLIKECIRLLPGLKTTQYHIVTIQGTNTTLQDSQVLDGIIFPSPFTYSGFEQLPKRIVRPRTLFISEDIEIRKSISSNSTIQIEDMSNYFDFVNIEKKLMEDRLRAIFERQVNVLFSSGVIGDLAIQQLGSSGSQTTGFGRIDSELMKRLQTALGGYSQHILDDLEPTGNESYGECDLYYQQVIGKKSYEIFKGCKGRYITIILRGSSSRVLEEAKIGLTNTLKSISNLLNGDSLVVGGGGSFEISLVNELERFKLLSSKDLNIREKLIIESFQNSLISSVQQLANNSHCDGSSLTEQLVHLDDHNYGIDVENATLSNLVEQNIIEPFSQKKVIINSVLDSLNLFLSIQ